ncbi:hypothetical protein PYW08_016790 [Mythimna loreyi]|uniref:Uncharacterized protein n=1 Tax=Mythimna loreyi TaxID=667449 RepID=A0ACC2R049_9NEOP|nr:hypothetical protein PYW08_016790 [Mythimna loreyi]
MLNDIECVQLSQCEILEPKIRIQFKPIRRYTSPTICMSILIFMFLVYYTPWLYPMIIKPNNTEDALPSAEDPNFYPKARSIFFHETLSSGLHVRHACAVEAAARAHPKSEVYVLFSNPVTDFDLKTGCLADLRQFSNVKFLRVHTAEYSKGTVVQSVLLNDVLQSTFRIQHEADILRMLTLNKWGGIYLDTDMIVTKSLEHLPLNFIAKETRKVFATGILSFAKDEIGTNLTRNIIKEISKKYNPMLWASISINAIDPVIRKLCPKVVSYEDFQKEPFINCQGLTIFNRDLFYPQHFSQVHDLFKTQPKPYDLTRPYTYHIRIRQIMKKSRKTKRGFSFACITMCIILFVKELYMISYWNTIANYYSNEGDALSSAEDPNFTPKLNNSLFFHKTSYNGELNAREACSVEAAARAHPTREIYVLFSVPVTDHELKTGCLAKLHRFPNVKFLRVHIDQYSKGTVVQPILCNDLKESRYPIQHTADILRMLTLNKWGGISLESDMVVVKPLDILPPNWIVKQSEKFVAPGIMSFSKDEIGTNITNSILEEIFKTYNPNDKLVTGKSAIRKVVQRMCPVRIRWENCPGKAI